MKANFMKRLCSNPLRALMILGGVTALALNWGCLADGPVIETQDGPVKGFEDVSDTWVWKAIPFAKPPVGPLRWKAPQDPDPWVEPLEETAFASQCTQCFFVGSTIYGSEDCLYLNVWRPQSDEEDLQGQDLPVYFWIHGGGNSVGMASIPDYFGANLASKANMVVVTTQYRLGPLGWFTHPALRSGALGAEEDDSGNYGTLDLIKALTWVRDNIEAFGGDPDNVTIAGESAGGFNVMSLMISPPAAGFFHRAVCQSGYPNSTSVEDGETGAQEVILKLLVQDGTAADQAEAETHLSGMSLAEIAAYLRSKAADRLLSTYDTMLGGMIVSSELGLFPNIFQDGTVIPASGFETLVTGDYSNKVPIILGTNKEETKLFLFGDFYFFGKDELYQIVSSYSSDVWKAVGVDEVARKLRSNGDQPGVYAYQFLWGAGGDTGESALPDPLGFILGSFHNLEIPFFFGNDSLDVVLQAVLFTEENRIGREALTEAMMSYLAQFARTGDPNLPESGLPIWSPWSNTEGGPKSLLLDVDESQALDVEMSTLELTEAGIKAELAGLVSDPLYAEALEYLESMGLFW